MDHVPKWIRFSWVRGLRLFFFHRSFVFVPPPSSWIHFIPRRITWLRAFPRKISFLSRLRGNRKKALVDGGPTRVSRGITGRLKVGLALRREIDYFFWGASGSFPLWAFEDLGKLMKRTVIVWTFKSSCNGSAGHISLKYRLIAGITWSCVNNPIGFRPVKLNQFQKTFIWKPGFSNQVPVNFSN